MSMLGDIAKTAALGGAAFMTGGASLAAPVVAGSLGYFGQQSANKESAASTAKQMQFQENMSNTAHRREVVDLKAAGLNPILSATKGVGATTPSGSSYNAGNSMNTAANQDYNFALKSAQLRLIQSQANSATASSNYYNTMAGKAAVDTEAAKADLAGKQTEGAIDNSWFGKTLRYVNRTSQALQGTAGAVQSVSNSARAVGHHVNSINAAIKRHRNLKAANAHLKSEHENLIHWAHQAKSFESDNDSFNPMLPKW